MTAVEEDFGAAVPAVVPFVGHLGLAVEATTSRQRVSLPDDRALGNHVGTRHAGALFTAAETASGMAVFALMTRAGMTATPIVAKAEIRYVAPARGVITATPLLGAADDAVATEFQSRNRAPVTVSAELTDEAGSVVATASFSWLLRGPKEGPST